MCELWPWINLCSTILPFIAANHCQFRGIPRSISHRFDEGCWFRPGIPRRFPGLRCLRNLEIQKTSIAAQLHELERKKAFQVHLGEGFKVNEARKSASTVNSSRDCRRITKASALEKLLAIAYPLLVFHQNMGNRGSSLVHGSETLQPSSSKTWLCSQGSFLMRARAHQLSL